MSQKLYTAAEARRIDIERGGEGYIKRAESWHYGEGVGLRFNMYLQIWEWNDNLLHYTNPDIPQEKWLPLTASLEAPTPEPEKQLARSNVTDSQLLAEAHAALLNDRKRIEDLEKELAEYKDHYHEILADHGELTQKFDEIKEKQRQKVEQLEKELAEREKTINIQKQTISNREQELDKLKWKQRRKSCKGEKPTTNQKIIFLDGNSMLQRGQYIPLHSQWYLHVGENHYIALASSTVENWTWKYEADL